MRRTTAPLMLAAIGVAIVVLLCSPPLLAQEKPLDNAEIVKLVKLDMGDAVVIAYGEITGGGGGQGSLFEFGVDQ